MDNAGQRRYPPGRVHVVLLGFWLVCVVASGSYAAFGVWTGQRDAQRRGLTLLALAHLFVGVFWVGVPAVCALAALICALGAAEIGRHYPLPRWLAPLLALVVAAGVGWDTRLLWAGLAVSATVVAATALSLRARSAAFGLLFVAGIVGVGAGGMVQLARADIDGLIGLALLLQLNDSFGLLVGRRFGKTRPFPQISPNKSVEGYLGGAVAATLGVGLLYTLVPALVGVSALRSLALLAAVLVLGNGGDLLLSALKRELGLKDFGTVLPGHGGVLDRLDSLLLTAPLWSVLW